MNNFHQVWMPLRSDPFKPPPPPPSPKQIKVGTKWSQQWQEVTCTVIFLYLVIYIYLSWWYLVYPFFCPTRGCLGRSSGENLCILLECEFSMNSEYTFQVMSKFPIQHQIASVRSLPWALGFHHPSVVPDQERDVQMHAMGLGQNAELQRNLAKIPCWFLR